MTGKSRRKREAERRAREEAAAEQPTGFIRSADPETGEEDRMAVYLPEGVTFADLQVTDVGHGGAMLRMDGGP